MGKSLSSITNLVNLYKQQEQYQLKHIKQVKPISIIQRVGGGAEEKSKKKQKRMESGSDVGNSNNININIMDSTTNTRLPLSEVVSDCVKRWFKDTLKEAKAGDINMQVLVSQMYYSGYGIPIDAQKGRIWMSRASRIRSSVWKVCDKHPGYNASDSDSDELKGES